MINLKINPNNDHDYPSAPDNSCYHNKINGVNNHQNHNDPDNWADHKIAVWADKFHRSDHAPDNWGRDNNAT